MLNVPLRTASFSSFVVKSLSILPGADFRSEFSKTGTVFIRPSALATSVTGCRGRLFDAGIGTIKPTLPSFGQIYSASASAKTDARSHCDRYFS